MDEKRYILSCASEEQKNAILNGLWMSYQFAYANADKNVYGNWEIYTQVKMSQHASEIVSLIEKAQLGDESEQIAILLNNLAVLKEQEL
jgi:hypothetical protein